MKVITREVTRLGDDLAQARVDLATERAIRLELERRTAANTATIDWLTTEITQLRLERAALYERVLQVTLPVVEITREAPEPAAEPRVPQYAPEVLKNMPMVTIPMPRAPKPAGGGAPPEMVSFDHVPDDVAAELGAANFSTGE